MIKDLSDQYSEGKFTFTRLEPNTIPWLNYRDSGLGGSDTGIILHQSKWQSKYEAFHYHAHLVQRPEINNEATFNGTHLEDYVANLWRHVDPTDILSYMDNVTHETPLREYGVVPGFVRNEDYPHLFASTDGVILKGQTKYKQNEDGSIVENGVLEKNGILEIKTISSYAFKSYGNKLPESYIIQVQTYMAVYELDYAEIAVLIDGRNFKVFIVERDQDYINLILRETSEFWDNVMEARALLYEAREANKKAEAVPAHESKEYIDIASENMQRIDELTPEIDGSEATALFMSDNYKSNSKFSKMMADNADIVMKDNLNVIKDIQAILKKEEQYIKNVFVDKMFKESIPYLEFEDQGYMKYYMRKGGKNMTFDNRSKKRPDSKTIAEETTSELMQKAYSSLHDIY